MGDATTQAGVCRVMAFLAWVGAGVGTLSVLYAVGSALGYRFGYIDLGTALGTGFRWGVYGALSGLAAILFAGLVLTLQATRFHLIAIVGSLVTLGFVMIVVPQIMTARQVPPIHDISTDTENPPPFVAILPLRAAECELPKNGRCNNPEYEAEPDYIVKRGQTVPRLQTYAYPDIQPLIVEKTPEFVFGKALYVVRKMKLEMVEANEAEGRIEASHTSFWFGFTDDVVIRVKGQDGGTTRLDIRSESRVGGSDVGMNAKRIRDFLTRMKVAIGNTGE